VDEVANAIGGNKAGLLSDSSNPADQATIKEASGKAALPTKALDTINSLSSARGVSCCRAENGTKES